MVERSDELEKTVTRYWKGCLVFVLLDDRTETLAGDWKSRELNNLSADRRHGLSSLLLK